MEHRHRAAQIGQMPDRAFGQVGVVHQEHVAGRHGVRREIAHHGVRHGGIGAAGEFPAIAVEQADAIIVRLADHRRARGALDGIFDLRLDGIERALDDLQDDGIDLAPGQIRRGRPRPFLAVHIHHRGRAFVERPQFFTFLRPCRCRLAQSYLAHKGMSGFDFPRPIQAPNPLARGKIPVTSARR